MMNFALCTDENFVFPCLVSVLSIIENNRNEDLNIYILTDNLSEDIRKRFKQLSLEYAKKIEIIDIDANCIKNLKTSGRYRKSMYYRFLLPGLLPTVSKVLYLDCDIMVRGSLSSLFELNITDYALGAVYDQNCDFLKTINRVKIESPYFNSGVLLMNLDYWRSNNIANELIDFIYSNPDRCLYPDQDALNIVLDKKVKYIDPSYNYQEGWICNLSSSYVHYSRLEQIEEAKKNPLVVHFCVDEKPWFKECKNPYKKEYQDYMRNPIVNGFQIIHLRSLKYRLIHSIHYYLGGIYRKIK